MEKPDYEWLQWLQKGTTGDGELQLVTEGQNSSGYKWLWVTITFDCYTYDHTWQTNIILKIGILH